ALPAPGKSGGAYQDGVYGVPPFVFLNHQGDFESVSTFAHEWGHAMHTAIANRAQPYETAGYSLFIAEIASTANEL
ncbi:M3 family metallopeptidase, partial [Vibrio parahaemolyticus]